MHRDATHNAYAHYGIRNKRYKLIYWYEQGLGLPETQPGSEPPEWELFDCIEDPLELMNCYHDPAYRSVVSEMTELLERKMAEIGDEPMHPATGRNVLSRVLGECRQRPSTERQAAVAFSVD